MFFKIYLFSGLFFSAVHLGASEPALAEPLLEDEFIAFFAEKPFFSLQKLIHAYHFVKKPTGERYTPEEFVEEVFPQLVFQEGLLVYTEMVMDAMEDVKVTHPCLFFGVDQKEIEDRLCKQYVLMKEQARSTYQKEKENPTLSAAEKKQMAQRLNIFLSAGKKKYVRDLKKQYFAKEIFERIYPADDNILVELLEKTKTDDETTDEPKQLLKQRHINLINQKIQLVQKEVEKYITYAYDDPAVLVEKLKKSVPQEEA